MRRSIKERKKVIVVYEHMPTHVSVSSMQNTIKYRHYISVFGMPCVVCVLHHNSCERVKYSGLTNDRKTQKKVVSFIFFSLMEFVFAGSSSLLEYFFCLLFVLYDDNIIDRCRSQKFIYSSTNFFLVSRVL